MPSVPQNIYHDIRPIGPSGSFLVSHPTGTAGIAHTEWMRLSPSRLGTDLAITSVTPNNSAALVGSAITNPIFYITYTGSPSGATITSTATGTQDIADPFTAHQWFDTFPTGLPNSSRLFTVTASGEFNTTSASTRIYYLQKMYWGVGATGTYDTAFIISLGNSALSSGHNIEFTASPSATQYIFYAFRAAAGQALFTDKASNMRGGFTLDGSGITFTNTAGYAEAYNVWRSDYPGLSTSTIIVGSGV